MADLVAGRVELSFLTVLAQEDARAQIQYIGGVPVGGTPQQFGRLIEEDRKRYALMIHERQIKVD